MDYKKLQNRISKNKPVSPDGLYLYCQVKGYIYDNVTKGEFISALKKLKEEKMTTKKNIEFIMYADRIFHNVPLACNSDHMRNYIKLIIGVVKNSNTERFNYVGDLLFNIDYMQGNYSIDYLVDNRDMLYEKGRIANDFWYWLDLLAQYEYIERHFELYFTMTGKNPHKEVDKLFKYGLRPYPEYAVTRGLKNNDRREIF